VLLVGLVVVLWSLGMRCGPAWGAVLYGLCLWPVTMTGGKADMSCVLAVLVRGGYISSSRIICGVRLGVVITSRLAGMATLRGAACCVVSCIAGATLIGGSFRLVIGCTDNMLDWVVPCKTTINWVSTLLWLLVSGARGKLAEGLRSAVVMSVTPARIMSIDKAVGMVTLVGSQVKVSHMHWAQVSVIHTV